MRVATSAIDSRRGQRARSSCCPTAGFDVGDARLRGRGPARRVARRRRRQGDPRLGRWHAREPMGLRGRRRLSADAAGAAERPGPRRDESASLSAPMPATVRAVLVDAGQTVAARRNSRHPRSDEDGAAGARAARRRREDDALSAGRARAAWHAAPGDADDRPAASPPRHRRRGRPARRAAERAVDRAAADQGRVRRSACRAPACRSSRSTAFVSPKWVPQMADAADVCAAITRRPGHAIPGARPEPDRTRARASTPASRDRDLRRGVRDVQPQEHQQGIDESLDGLSPTLPPRRVAADCASAATSRPRSAVRTKAPLPSSESSRSPRG